MLNGRSLWNIGVPTDGRHASNMNFVNFTTGTINVAEYIYPSGTPGVTDGLFLIMLSVLLLFCFLFPFGTYTTVVCMGVIQFTRMFSGVLLTVRLRSLTCDVRFFRYSPQLFPDNYQSLWFHRSVYFYMSGIFLTKINLVFAK